jgi:uncharacterized protein (TIGR00369 family)
MTEIPHAPIAELVGMELVELGEGRATFALDPAERHYNPLGTVHGGVAATLLDSAMGVAVHTTLDDGETYTTLELKVNFVRAITASTGRIVASGSVIHRGGRVATAEARLTDAGGRLLAHATSTCMMLRGGPASGGDVQPPAPAM